MGAYPAYNYGSLARDFDYDRYAYQPQWQEEREVKAAPSRRISVLPGGARQARPDAQPSLAVRFARVILACVLVFAGIGFCRISLSSATVAEALEARQVTKQLNDARSSISELEVMQSSLSNPTRIKTEAAAIGMVAPTTTSVIDLGEDIVSTDDSGNLSLTASVETLVAQ